LVRERCGLATFPAAISRSWLTWSLAEQGAFEKGIISGLEGIRLAETVSHAYSLSQACWHLAVLYGIRGDFRSATDLAERSLVLAQDGNVGVMLPLALWTLGHVRALSGQVAEGCSLIQHAVEVLQASGAMLFHPLAQVHLGEGSLLAHRQDEALKFARSGLTIARERGHRGYEAWALRLLGEIASHRGPPSGESADDHYRQAMTLADELGMRPLAAHCHLGLGRLSRRTGQREQAQEHLAIATTMYREMDMRYWLEQAEAELRPP
jgi:tetratricopeptide (TPR) repeat protein